MAQSEGKDVRMDRVASGDDRASCTEVDGFLEESTEGGVMVIDDIVARATKQAADDIDKLAEEMGLQSTFKGIPAIEEWYRRLMIMAWMNGATWGFGEGIQAGGQIGVAEAIAEVHRMLNQVITGQDNPDAA